MTRGISLSQDLKLLVNNQRYSDIEILCEDGVKLYANRALLAARSEIFDGLLYNGMRESFDNKISFPEISSSVMEIVLEFLYTGCDLKDYLTHDNIIELYHAADYFQMFDLRNSIIKIVDDILNTNLKQSCAPELLTRAITKMSASADCEFIDLLIESVAKINLESIGFDRFSLKALLCLLSHTQNNKMIPFATPEYTVFRYSLIRVTDQISKDASSILEIYLPPLSKISGHPIQVDTVDDPKFVEIRSEIIQMFTPLFEYIEFWRIDAKILHYIIEPLEIIPKDIMFEIYRTIAKLNKSQTPDTRGIPYIYIEDSAEYVWDMNFCGSQLIVEDVEKTIVTAIPECTNNQSVRAKIAMIDRGQYEWDVIIESMCDNNIWVGVMSEENFDYNKSACDQPNGWVYGSQGVYTNNNINIKCDTSFSVGDRITVHLNMNNKTCVFSVNGKIQGTAWSNLPSKLYPIVSFSHPGRIRIQPPQPREIYELD
ncbi:concanavalin A-like lectin/glucanase domain-containing protein [Glomus cerebriforme]|uniref:Concanavalin A-like lectin/glucanase domain-containing protein n=1 Tax=Glomus cerebriforme TaxID=658196 RepID=A0A397TBR6_9GLOM|nr:concanavalin A-like lectin/glucanase domain-containing protein [Glomus cerebriforme]